MDSSLNIPRKVEKAGFFPQRCSFSRFFFWPGLMTPQVSYTSVQSKWWLWCPEDMFSITAMENPGKRHWLLTAILIMIPFLQNPHTDHLALLGSAAHYLVSNVDLPNIPSCQWHVVPFQSVHWSGTQASPRFQPSIASCKTQLHCSSRGCSSRSSSRKSPKWHSKVQAASCFSLEISPPCSPSHHHPLCSPGPLWHRLTPIFL